MGFKLTLPKENNSLCCDFKDAYWVIEDLRYETKDNEFLVVFWLNCYPSRNSSKMTGKVVESLDIGRSEQTIYNGKLYEYIGVEKASSIFPNGIPTSSDEQKTTIYKYIKETSSLPFKDVLE